MFSHNSDSDDSHYSAGSKEEQIQPVKKARYTRSKGPPTLTLEQSSVLKSSSSNSKFHENFNVDSNFVEQNKTDILDVKKSLSGNETFHSFFINHSFSFGTTTIGIE